MEVEEKVATNYEVSKVCFDDTAFIGFWEEFIAQTEAFSSEVSKIQVPSNYKNTISDLENLSSYIVKGINSLKNIPDSILNCSKTAFDKLVEEFKPIKADYERAIKQCEGFISKADEADQNFSIYSRRLSELPIPNLGDENYSECISRRSELAARKINALTSRNTNLTNANSVINNQIIPSITKMKDLLENGLKISNN